MTSPVVRWLVARQRETGGTLPLDRFATGPRESERHVATPPDAADMTPREGRQRMSRVMASQRYPEPSYPFAWTRPPVSGNVINGLGEPDRRRPSKVFHTMDYSTPWGGLEFLFHLSTHAASFRRAQLASWRNRHREGPLAPQRLEVDDPVAMAEHVKAVGLGLGAVAVGITRVDQAHVYDDSELPYPTAVSIAVTMDRETMLAAPYEPAAVEVMDAYLEVGDIAIELARRIRAAGWGAVAATNLDGDASPVVHVPVAIDAGLGQLGKHGSLITREHGSNVRLATVLTDLPLAHDLPVDVGVDDLCASCRICTDNCPPNAILDDKQLVRGEQRWYVDFDACVPYFSDNGGCGIGIEVCPWSEPGQGPVISDRMLSRREA